jgi:O-antigen ligase
LATAAASTLGTNYLCTALLGLLLLAVGLSYIGAPTWAVITLALALVPAILAGPRTGLWMGTAYVLLAVTIAPQSLGEWSIAPEFYYWAVGIFLVSVPLMVRLGWRWLVASGEGWRALRTAPAVTALLVIALASSLQAYHLGAEKSYIARQLFGVLLFVGYFYATSQFIRYREQAELLVNRIILVAIPAALYTAVVYRDTGQVVGLFKRHLALFAAAMAVYAIAQLLCATRVRERLLWGLQAAALSVNVVIFRSRAALTLAILCSLAAPLFLAKPVIRRRLLLAGAVLLIMTLLGLGRFLFSIQAGSPTRDWLVENVVLDPSALSRLDQVRSALEVAQVHPLLGAGLGSTLTYFEAYYGDYNTVALVDQGYAYILSKLGLLGLAVFLWLAVSVIRKSGMPTRDGMHLGLLLVFVFHLLLQNNGPVFFHFETAAWIGTTSALLYRVNDLKADRASANGGYRAPLSTT